MNIFKLDQDKKSLVELASKLHQSYVSNDPFPNIIVDDLFSEEILKNIVTDIENIKEYEVAKNNLTHVNQKYGIYDLEKMPKSLSSFIIEMHSVKMLRFLEELTGIKSLIPDPYCFGGGYHEIRKGGFLKMHTDFNWHNKLELHRRVNVLIYLNEDWDDSYGGFLELTPPDFSYNKSIKPVFNRMVVFSTTDFSFHGHPHPMTCPENRVRRSIALYYYTSTRPQEETNTGKRIDTDYRNEKGSYLNQKNNEAENNKPKKNGRNKSKILISAIRKITFSRKKF